jgi:Cu/Ag efflux protein CusF
MNKTTAVLAALLALGAAAAFAAENVGNKDDSTTAVAQAAGDQMTEGEVRKIDKDAGKITLKHGEIKNLGMPPMTMVFRVKDPSLLEKAQPGAKVRFRAEQQGGALLVTAMEPAK